MASNERDEETVRRWPLAWRLIFLLAAAALCWGGVLLVLWLAFNHRH